MGTGPKLSNQNEAILNTLQSILASAAAPLTPLCPLAIPAVHRVRLGCAHPWVSPALCPCPPPVLREHGKSLEKAQFCTYDNSVTGAVPTRRTFSCYYPVITQQHTYPVLGAIRNPEVMESTPEALGMQLSGCLLSI